MSAAIKFKNLTIGGGAKISIQSMLNVDTMNEQAVKNQIDRLVESGCDVIRLAVESEQAALFCKRYIDYTNALVVADVQFDHRIAIKCCEVGFEKIRFNPGNIGGEDKAIKIAQAAKMHGTAIRIGANGGSIDKEALKSCGGNHAKALYCSVLDSLEMLEKSGLSRIILSVKSSSIATTVSACRLLSDSCAYPLHIGITESGRGDSGIIKSAIGIGACLLDGIGDTIRVSLTSDPVDEVLAAKKILSALRLDDSVEIVSCPTCARCSVDLESMVKEVESITAGINKKLKIAVMGCAVNGPGEAADADFGIAFGKQNAAVFMHGNIVKTVEKSNAIEALKKLILDFTP